MVSKSRSRADLVQSAEIMKAMSMTRGLLWRMVEDGEFPPLVSEIGKHRQWDRAAFNEWLNAKAGFVPTKKQPRVVLLRTNQVLALTTFSRVTLYSMINTSNFPKSIKLSPYGRDKDKNSYWPEHLVKQWLSDKALAACGTSLSDSDVLMNLSEVMELVGINRGKIIRLCAVKKFPDPLKVNSKSNRWIKRQVDAYVKAGCFWASEDGVFSRKKVGQK